MAGVIGAVVSGAVGPGALGLVLIGLVATAWAQIHPARRGRYPLDLAALVPEWRFYAQRSIRDADDLARDPHLVIRDRDAGGQLGNGPVGSWRALLWPPERRLLHALWNPRSRVDEAILSIAEDLGVAATCGPAPMVQQSIGYLVLLRAAMAAPTTPGADERQFAVVEAVGRGRRDIAIVFVSAWHRW
jgi:hypothetical protein